MSIKVNQDLCIGCGACVATCTDVFKLGESGKAEVVSQNNVECAKNAASVCPVQAISVE
jgi:ferredoxin